MRVFVACGDTLWPCGTFSWEVSNSTPTTLTVQRSEVLLMGVDTLFVNTSQCVGVSLDLSAQLH